MIEERAAKVTLLILDVDGVLTEGRIIINERGEEIKVFDAKDGHGLKMLIRAGIEVVIITGRRSGAVESRAKGLGIREVHQGIEDKASLGKRIIRDRGLERGQVCCIGDDLPDIPLFHLAGLSVAVADAVPEVKEAAVFVTENGGGKGAVREVCELILKAQKRWPPFQSTSSGPGKIGFTP
ncbi:MAG: HAD hydrolase family protein [Deltaproteobacteria bacterium]|nr:HAD hydrolase family protein [Deltaproteobacteria bacterium]